MSTRENRLHDEIHALRAQVRRDHALTAECAVTIAAQQAEIMKLNMIIEAFVYVAQEGK